MKYYAGMDIGGTFARIRIVLEDGTLLGERKTNGCTYNVSGYEKARHVYQEAVSQVLSEWGLTPGECLGFCAAVSGVDNEKQARECREIFTGLGIQEDRVLVYNDCEIILELTDAPAVVLVAGTGSIAFGKNSEGRTVRCGGWGPVLSDEGSGMDMGKRVLRAVGDHMDGRKACPVLYELFAEKCSVCSVDELDNYIYENFSDKPKIADFALLAEEACRRGDRAAEQILKDCAQALFELARDTAEKVKKTGEEPEKLFLWGGVVTKNRLVAEGVKERMKETYPEMEIVCPQMEVTEIAVRRAAQIQAYGTGL